MNCMDSLKNNLTDIINNDLYRKRMFTEVQGKFIKINHKWLINFSSNDYLGLSQNSNLKMKAKQAIDAYGVGSTSSAIVSGSHFLIEILEARMAQFTGYQKALLFNSGYHANLAVMSLLSKVSKSIIADKFIHASILDGINLAGMKLKRYPHQNIDSLELIVKKNPEAKYIITEGIFSMDGDISPLSSIASKAKLPLIIDDAHGFGVMGNCGKGSVDKAKLEEKDVPILILPCGKSMGAMGALVCSSKAVIDLLIQTSRSYIYTTALSIPIVAALNEALILVENSHDLREQLFKNIDFFNFYANKLGIRLVTFDLTPIRSIVIGENKKTKNMQLGLKNNGFYVSCIRPPTVPLHSSRLRISLTALHSIEDIRKLLDNLVRMI